MAGRFNYPVPTTVGNIATNPSDTADTAANKGYVDSKAGGAQFLYQLQDVDVNETGRTQITLTGSPTPIDEVQNSILNIQPGVTFTGLAAGDFISPTQTFPELVKILSITAGGAGSQNINVQGDATIWIGDGSFTNPQYQTIWKATPSINVNDVLTWNGTVWTNQAVSGGQIFFDSNSYVSTTFLTDGNSPQGQGFFSVAGNVVSTFPNNTVITFANNVSATRYTVTNAVFQSTVTNISITPSLASTIPNATLIYRYTGSRNSFNEIIPGTNISGSVTSNVLTINSSSQVIPSFGFRDDVAYVCRTNDDNAFNGFATSDQATATITFATAVPANSSIGNTAVVFSTVVPASFIDGVSVLAFSNPDLFNISLANLDVAAGPTYFIAGAVNAAPGTLIPAGTYTILVARAATVQTIQSLVGDATLVSSDNSVLFNTVGQNINVRAASTGGGGAGQATATNVGDYVDNAINEYVQTGISNLGYIQVGTISAFTNNPRIVQPTSSPPTGGYTFFNGAAQANVPSVVAELGPQRQLFRAYMTGQWSLVPSGYTFYRQSVGGGFVLAPVFMRSGGDWQATTTDLFPGFTNTSVGLLAPLTTVTPTPFRGGVSGGPRWTQQVFQVGGISTAFAGSQVNQTAVRITLANSATVSVFRGQEVTVPLKNLLSNDYIGTEFLVDVNASNSNTIDLILPTGTPIGTGFDQNLDIFTDRNIYVWTAGFPPVNTTFSGTAIVEVWLEANVWVGNTTGSGLWPNGFALPASNPATQYNLTFTVELPDGCTLTSVFYKMFSEQADSWMAPNSGTQWNNSITVNYSQGGGGGGTGTVTSVGFSAPASNAFAVTNPTTNATIGFQNVGATPTNVFLRGDGSWQVPSTSGTLLYSDFLASARYNNTITPTAATANFTVPSATNVPGTVHYYVRYTSAGVSTPLFRFVPTTDSALTSLSYESFWSTFSGGVLSGLLVQKGQV